MRKGFTLIELLVVIAITAIVALLFLTLTAMIGSCTAETEEQSVTQQTTGPELKPVPGRTAYESQHRAWLNEEARAIRLETLELHETLKRIERKLNER